MTWYKTGTVQVTLNSNAVVGTGTAFIANARVGDAFSGPDGNWYEVINVVSDTSLGIYPNYRGASVVSGGVYVIAPMEGYVKDSADALRAATQVIGQQAQDLTDSAAMAAASAASATQAKDSATASSSQALASKNSAYESELSAAASKNASATSEANALSSKNSAAQSATAAANSASQAASTLSSKASKGANSDITSLTGLTTPLSIAQGGNGGSAPSKAGTDDANNTTSPGVYAFSAGGLNLPTTSAAYYLRVTINNSLVIQEALGMTSALNGKNYTRVFNGSSWSAWVPYAPTSSSAAWGSITGTLSAQTDLQVALGAKLDVSSQSIAKAFAAIAGGASPSIRSSVGVTSVTRESMGQYLVTTSQPWPVATVIAALNNSYAYNQTIICQQVTDTTFRIVCGANGAAQDFSFLSILIFKA